MPRSDISSYGLFALESFAVGAVTYQFGTRIEQTDIRPDGIKTLSYTPISASMSALWKINEQNSVNLAATSSSRAPQVQELLSDSYHDATRSYDRGDINLKEETTYNLDSGYRPFQTRAPSRTIGLAWRKNQHPRPSDRRNRPPGNTGVTAAGNIKTIQTASKTKNDSLPYLLLDLLLRIIIICIR